jgi:hypothetical protein
LAVAALVAAPATVFAAELFGATLTPGAEVPPVEGSEASGSASVTISDDATSIDYEVSYTGLSGAAGAAHIHYGAADVAGPVMLPLAVGESPFSGTLTEADFTPVEGGPQTWEEGLAAIRDGLTYINVHTEANPGGEIRGQLAVVPDTATATEGSTVVAGPAMIALIMAAVGAIVLAVSFRRLWTNRV